MFIKEKSLADAFTDMINNIGTPDYKGSDSLSLPSDTAPDFFSSAGTVVSDLLKGIIGKVPSFLDTLNVSQTNQAQIDLLMAKKQLSQAEAEDEVRKTNAKTVQLVGVVATAGMISIAGIILLKKRKGR
jgi:hypothetical protein